MTDLRNKHIGRLPGIEAKFDAVYAFAKQMADKISQQFPSVVFVALVGAWARGVPSDEDIDFVISSTRKSDLGKIINMAKTTGLIAPLDLRTTFICYPFSTFQAKAFNDSSKTLFVRIARTSRALLRKFPLLKKVFLAILGKHKITFQKYEILPQTIQTYIPFFDKDNMLAQLQKEQRTILKSSLSKTELLLYSRNGFQKLIDHYLSNNISKENVKRALLKSDIDWKEYLDRAGKVYSASGKPLIPELREYMLK